MKPGFDFTSETRTKTLSHLKQEIDEGRYKNRLQLCKAFGGAEHQEACDEAGIYMEKMQLLCAQCNLFLTFLELVPNEKQY